MDVIGQFDNSSSDVVPRYNKHGQLLSQEERQQIADRKGICVVCGIRTHSGKGLLRRKAFDNEDVCQGVCIRCNPSKVPRSVWEAWDLRNRPAAVVQAVVPQRTPKPPGSTASSAQSSGGPQRAPPPSSSSASSTRKPSSAASRRIVTQPSTMRTQPLSSQSSSVPSAPVAPKRTHSYGHDQPTSAGRSGTPGLGKYLSDNRNNVAPPPRQMDMSAHSSASAASSHASNAQVAGGSGGLYKGYDSSMGDQSGSFSVQSTATHQHQRQYSGEIDNTMRSHSSFNNVPIQPTGPDSRMDTRMLQQQNEEDSLHAEELDLLQEHPPPQRAMYSKIGTNLPDAANRDMNSSQTKLQISLRDNFKGDEGANSPTHDQLHDLQNSTNDPARMRVILHNLRNTNNEDQPEAVPTLTDILAACAHDMRIADVALGALWRSAAASVEAKVEVLHSGAIAVILDVLREHDDPEFSQWALGVLTSLAFHNDGKRILTQKGAPELILGVMARQRKNAGVFEWSCRCLHNLVFSYDEEGAWPADASILNANILAIEEANGIALIVDAMGQNLSEPVAQLWAVKILWRLLDAPESNSRQRAIRRLNVIRKISSASYVPVAAKLLRQQSTAGELFLRTAEMLSGVMLGIGFENNVFSLAPMIDTVSSSIAPLIRRMRDSPDNQEIQEAGCRLLAALTVPGGELLAYMVESGVPEAMVYAMEFLSDQQEVVESAAWGLWKLSSDDMAMEPGTIRKVLSVLKTLAAQHTDSHILKNAVPGFIANTCGIEGMDVSDFPLTDIASELCGGDAMTQATNCEVLAQMCSQYPEKAETVLQSVGINRIVQTLNESSMELRNSYLSLLTAASLGSPQARAKISHSGALSAAVGLLGAATEKEEGSALLQFVVALTSFEDFKIATVPHGFDRAMLRCLDMFGADNDCCILTCRAITGVTSRSRHSFDTASLIQPIANRIDRPDLPETVNMEACRVVWAVCSKNLVSNTSVLRMIMVKILGLMKFYDGEAHPFNIAMQEVAAGTLGALASCIRKNPIPIEPKEIDGFMRIVYKAIGLQAQAKEILSGILTAVYHLCFSHEAALLQSGVIVITMDIMAACATDASIQEKGCMVLGQLSSSENIQVTLTIVETDGVAVLLEALRAFAWNVGIQTAACRALSHLSTDDETRMLIGALDGLNLLVATLNAHGDDIDVLETAYSALLNLTSDAAPQFINFPATVRIVVSTMRKYASAVSLRENGLGILQNMCMKGAEAKNIIAEEGGINTVTSALKENLETPTVVERAFSTLWSLAVLSANQQRISDADGIGLVVCGMYATIEYERVQQQGCGCLCTFALDVENRIRIREEGGADAVCLTGKAHYGSPAVQSEVCRCIAALAAPTQIPGRPIRGVKDSEFEAVTFAMKRYPNVDGVQIHGCSALMHMLQAEGVGPLVHSYQYVIRESIQIAVANFPAQCDPMAREIENLIRYY